MFGWRRFLFVFLIWSTVHCPWSDVFASITFTGRADLDFPAADCISDPGGKDVGMPGAFPSTRVSGFDIQAICLSYDPTNDTLYVGVETYPDSGGHPVIFGDAEGDGDPASADGTLQGLGGQDAASLSGSEFFTFTLDFDLDGAADLVVGDNTSTNLSQFKVVSGVIAPNNDLLLSFSPLFYGTAMAGVTTSLYASPVTAKPHLEFSLTGVSLVPQFAVLNFTDPDSSFQVHVTAGSFSDSGIGEDYYPYAITWQSFKVGVLQDTDGDNIPDAFDTDNDNDGISDLIEKNLSQYDTNHDGVLSAAEIAASGLDIDGDGDIDANDGVVWPDTDGDGTPDYLDSAPIPTPTTTPTPVGTFGPTIKVTSGNGSSGGSSSGSSGSGSLVGDELQGAGCQLMPGASGSFGSLFWGLLLMLWLGIIPRVWGLNVDLYRADSDGLGFPNIESTRTLAKKDFSAGLLQDLVNKPLQIGGTSSDSVVNYFYVWDMWGSYGIRDDLDVGINFPVSLVSQIKDIGATTDRTTTSIGDVRLQGKWRFLNDDQNILRSNFAVLTFLNLPSGNSDDFFGEGSVTGGLQGVAERKLGKHDFFLNLGVYARGKDSIVAPVSAGGTTLLTVGTEMTWGLGWRWQFTERHQWSLQSDFWGRTNFQSSINSPAEWDLAIAKRSSRIPIQASLGFGIGLGDGYGAPAYRVMAGLNYVPGSSFSRSSAK